MPVGQHQIWCQPRYGVLLMLTTFETAAGTVPGRDHLGRGNLLLGKNNQDSLHIHKSEECLIAVIADGCSSCKQSELGAQIATRLCAGIIKNAVLAGAFDKDRASIDWQQLKISILQGIANIAAKLSGADSSTFREVLHDCFLFTLLITVITPDATTILAFGDGVLILNGDVQVLPQFPDNAPPYIGYEVLPYLSHIANADLPYAAAPPNYLKCIPTEALDALVMGTDGLSDLISKEHKCIPGKGELIGAPAQLWMNDRFFAANDKEAITRWLRLINSEVVTLQQVDGEPYIQRDAGQLRDDTTVIAIRRSTPC